MSASVAATLIGSPVPADDGKFTAADVLAWDQSQQDWYIEVATGTAAVLASQNRSSQARCINDWYFKTDAIREKRNKDIRLAMRRFSDFHPTQIVIAVIEKACGELVFTK